jgi:hypothetical protein
LTLHAQVVRIVINMPTKEEMRKFSLAIEGMVSNTDFNYIEAIVEYCKDTGLEIEVAATLITSNLKGKIEEDAMNLNLLKIKVLVYLYDWL